MAVSSEKWDIVNAERATYTRMYPATSTIKCSNPLLSISIRDFEYVFLNGFAECHRAGKLPASAWRCRGFEISYSKSLS